MSLVAIKSSREATCGIPSSVRFRLANATKADTAKKGYLYTRTGSWTRGHENRKSIEVFLNHGGLSEVGKRIPKCFLAYRRVGKEVEIHGKSMPDTQCDSCTAVKDHSELRCTTK